MYDIGTTSLRLMASYLPSYEERQRNCEGLSISVSILKSPIALFLGYNSGIFEGAVDDYWARNIDILDIAAGILIWI